MVKRPVIYEDRYPDQGDPRLSGYSASKQQAEHTFAEAAEQSGMWDSITCCPADNVGPIQSAHQGDRGPWQGLMKKMLLGECNPAVHGYRPWHTVDVRDHGRGPDRHTRKRHGRQRRALHRLQRREDRCRGGVRTDRPPAARTRIRNAGHDGGSGTKKAWRGEASGRAVYFGTDLRNDRTRTLFGIEYRDLNDSLRDMAESLIGVGEVEPVLRPGFSLNRP